MKNKLSKILFLIVGFIFFSIYATAQTDNKSKFLLSGNILDMIAFNYFELFKKFGAVPLIKDCYSINDNDKILNTPRSSTDEVVEFITSLCDSAAAKLPETYEAQYFGHITKGAALALKAKALLYAASPLYNGGEIDGVPVSVDGSTIKSTILATTNTDGKKLFNTEYDKEKWKKAADAAKTVIDMPTTKSFELVSTI